VDVRGDARLTIGVVVGVPVILIFVPAETLVTVPPPATHAVPEEPPRLDKT
jgi:hypothetical protein